MNELENEQDLKEQIQERFKQLPKVIQDAATSADVEKRLRILADTHQLHVDQWQLLENNVMLTLVGFQPMEELAENIRSDLGIREEAAERLAADVSKIVFEPIRQEMERELGHPDAKAKEMSDIEVAREHILTEHEAPGFGQQALEEEVPVSRSAPAVPQTPPPAIRPATPPPPPPTTRAERGPASGAYKSGEPSVARKSVEDDPYREPPQ